MPRLFLKIPKIISLATSHDLREEKMAVIIQEIVGRKHESRFYPDISGVARSFNFYPAGHARPEDGIISLALGLGRTIVDDGIAWSYSPSYPQANPPYNSIGELMGQTQRRFWVVNMARIPEYDPVKETEYLLQLDIEDADPDETLRFTASTYDPQSDRLYPGVSAGGTKIISFAPILLHRTIPLNDLVKDLLEISRKAIKSPVEIEFAVTLDPREGVPARFGFLQVRPMVVSQEKVSLEPEEMEGDQVLLASEKVLGNGIIDTILDIVYVKPDTFDTRNSRKIASEIEEFNKTLREARLPYLLIGFGRWGSADPWLGIPSSWGQIAGAKVIVESTLEDMNVDLSQGSHFFHNLSSFQISYFSVRHTGKYKIDWDWLDKQKPVRESANVRHVKLLAPLTVKVDGKTGRGLIRK